MLGTAHAEHIVLPNAELFYYPQFLTTDCSSNIDYFAQLLQKIPWTQHSITLFGRTQLMPRLTAWYADPNINYRYSGFTEPHHDWIPELIELKNIIEEISGTQFNGVLANLYRDQQDSMGWHADDEKNLGQKPIIASLSLGASREFQVRPKKNRTMNSTLKLLLNHGSLLIMRGDTQEYWQHQLPKQRHPITARINLTFRYVYN
ncbi:MAG: alpha-ketoglutarate-dependent dioxygenase AlkB [Gammaproteobacteria bacterium]|nr:alpha-ketoglutarate-dependent dioxygenase AlkB [Gammaproteobacteria bacterium]